VYGILYSKLGLVLSVGPSQELKRVRHFSRLQFVQLSGIWEIKREVSEEDVDIRLCVDLVIFWIKLGLELSVAEKGSIARSHKLLV